MSATLRWCQALLLAAALAACGRPDLCEEGLCPIGTTCIAETGACEAAAGAAPERVGLVGAFSLVRAVDGSLGVVGHAPGRKSLVHLASVAGSHEPSYIAGPAAVPGEAPAGNASSAVAAADGRLHVAWTRASDGTLWYATGSGGAWAREQVTVALAGTVDRQVAIGLWSGQPAIAWRASDLQQVRFAHRDAKGQWLAETVPPPAPRPGQANGKIDLGRSLAMVIAQSGPAIAAYDAEGGDLVLAVRGAAGWNVARVAGSHPVTGSDTGDMGNPAAIAVGATGDLVLAYRDRSGGRVLVARAKSGVVSHQVVDDGAWTDPVQGTRRVDLVGTALSIAVLGGGRAAVALQDASRLRVRVAVEKPSGGFTLHHVPGESRPHAWPRLWVRDNGTLVVGYLALDAQRGPGGGTFVTWTLSTGAAP